MSHGKKYLIDGQEVELVQSLANGQSLVAAIYEGNDDESEWSDNGKPFVVDKVFDVPPTERYHAEIQKLQKVIAEMEAKRDALAEAARETWQQKADREAKFKRHAVLDNVELFIDGKITHYVKLEYNYCPKVISVAETACHDDRHKFKLLTLGAKHGEPLRWEINGYADGSGSGWGVIPCISEEEAINHVKRLIAIEFQGNGGMNGVREDWVIGAEKYGVAVPDAYRKKVMTQKLASLKSNISYTRKQAQDYANTLANQQVEIERLEAALQPAVQSQP